MSTRPTVSVFSHTNANEVVAEVRMPHVFLAPVEMTWLASFTINYHAIPDKPMESIRRLV